MAPDPGTNQQSLMDYNAETIDDRKDLLMNAVVNYYQDVDSVDQAVALLEARNTIGADRLLVPMYLERSQIDSAQAVLNTLPADSLFDIAYRDYFQTLIDLRIAGITPDHMDSSQYAVMDALANGNSPMMYAAQALMTRYYGILYDLTWEEDHEDRAFQSTGTSPHSESTSGNFKLLPNPTSNTTRLLYDLADREAAAEVVVTDAVGRTVGTWALDPAGTEYILSSDQWGPGVYSVTVIQEGRVIGINPLSVVR